MGIFSETALLSTAYLGPVQYFSKFILYPGIKIECEETYPKQSYRNRCYIAGANGPLPLVIPVKKKYGNHTKTKDIEIDYDTNWKKIHRESIVSAYRSSPFFEFYEDDFISFYQQNEKYLIDLNHKLLTFLLGYFEIEMQIEYTTDYIADIPDHTDDLRQTIHPKARYKKQDINFESVCYTQVFEDKYGFVPNLSIIDLLFNEGPQSNEILRNCTKKKGQY